MQYWLMKSEADCYSIDDLKRDKMTAWTEVRNYQARNFIRSMKRGDRVLFYHSNGGRETGVVGEAEIVREAYPDKTQFDKKSEYFDENSDKKNPRWSCVDVAFIAKFTRGVYLPELKTDPAFKTLAVIQKGSRLSVLPVSKVHYDRIVKLGSQQ